MKTFRPCLKLLGGLGAIVLAVSMVFNPATATKASADPCWTILYWYVWYWDPTIPGWTWGIGPTLPWVGIPGNPQPPTGGGSSSTVYYGPKAGSDLGFIYTTNYGNIEDDMAVEVGSGWVVDGKFQPDTSPEAVGPVYLIYKTFADDSATTRYSYQTFVVTSNLNTAGLNTIADKKDWSRLSDGWITSINSSIPATGTGTSDPIYWQYRRFTGQDVSLSGYNPTIIATDVFVYTTGDGPNGGTVGESDSWVILSDGWCSTPGSVSTASRRTTYSPDTSLGYDRCMYVNKTYINAFNGDFSSTNTNEVVVYGGQGTNYSSLSEYGGTSAVDGYTRANTSAGAGNSRDSITTVQP